VVGERENRRARGRHACLLLARPLFLVPTTSTRLLRRLLFLIYTAENFEVTNNFNMLLRFLSC